MLGKFASEFREFAMRGNVIDMAVGIIIGAAFGAIVASFVNDVIMPVLGLVTGGMDFSQHFVNLGGARYETLEAATAAGAPVLRYGMFLNALLDFVLVALAIFVAIRAMNRMRRRQETTPAPPPEPSAQEKLLTEIRDLLNAGR